MCQQGFSQSDREEHHGLKILNNIGFKLNQEAGNLSSGMNRNPMQMPIIAPMTCPESS
jgi:hypothetical protein